MTAIGDHAPTFALPDTEGTTRGPGEARATVVVFTCNHCPYALAWHERIVTVACDYAGRAVRVLAVNPNDAENDAMLSGRDPNRVETPPVGCSVKWKT